MVPCRIGKILVDGVPTSEADLTPEQQQVLERMKRFLFDSSEDNNYYLKLPFTNTLGYEGRTMGPDWIFDPRRIVFRLDSLVDGSNGERQYIGQALVGKIRVGDVPLMGKNDPDKYDFSDFINDLTTAATSGDHGLLVVGPNGFDYWMDSVESEVDGLKVRIVVDAKRGKVYQIKTNENLFKPRFSVSEIDLKAKDSVGFLNYSNSLLVPEIAEKFLTSFLPTLKQIIRAKNQVDDQELSKILMKIFSGEITLEDLKTYVGFEEDVNKMIYDIIKGLSTDLPLRHKELSIALRLLSEKLLTFFQRAKEFVDDTFNNSFFIART